MSNPLLQIVFSLIIFDYIWLDSPTDEHSSHLNVSFTDKRNIKELRFVMTLEFQKIAIHGPNHQTNKYLKTTATTIRLKWRKKPPLSKSNGFHHFVGAFLSRCPLRRKSASISTLPKTSSDGASRSLKIDQEVQPNGRRVQKRYIRISQYSIKTKPGLEFQKWKHPKSCADLQDGKPT